MYSQLTLTFFNRRASLSSTLCTSNTIPTRGYCPLNTRYFENLRSNVVFLRNSRMVEISGRRVVGNVLPYQNELINLISLFLDSIAQGVQLSTGIQMFLCGCGSMCCSFRYTTQTALFWEWCKYRYQMKCRLYIFSSGDLVKELMFWTELKLDWESAWWPLVLKFIQAS